MFTPVGNRRKLAKQHHFLLRIILVKCTVGKLVKIS